MPTKREAMTAFALSQVGNGYLYGATGWICTPQRIEQQKRQYPEYAELMDRYGPKWYGLPCYDCAQLTRATAKRAGVALPSGATSQWRAHEVWAHRDVIDTLPDEAGIFLFTMRDGRMTHSGISVGGGEEVDARGHAYGVVRRRIADTAYTHWARLAIDYDAPQEAENPTPPGHDKPTLRRGSSGEDVRQLQQMLIDLGYDVGHSGADGLYGSGTQRAVRRFQRRYALAADGVAGRMTWAQLLYLTGGESGTSPEEESMQGSILVAGDLFTAMVQAVDGAERTADGMRLTLDPEAYAALRAALDAER